MYIKRDLKAILAGAAKLPAVAILGPRQSGKTTFSQNSFPKHKFISFENPSVREFATNDPESFLSDNENQHGLILDEFQYVPQILSYIQLEADAKKRPGYFILTGSQNFLMNKAITQSLAGRVAILTLLPFSISELKENNLLDQNADEAIFQGFYPRIFSEDVSPQVLYPSYIQSYIERDVRELANIGNLLTFKKFMSLCAGRIGQQLNVTDIAQNCGISADKADEWLSILEASYILFLLKPHHNNFNKRLVKTPKLYFYDTGLACNLLGLASVKELSLSSFRGGLFENLIIADLLKQYFNAGRTPPLYFWRDQNGRIEVDCLVDMGGKLFPMEIKASKTISHNFFIALADWNELASERPEDSTLIYAGKEKQTRSKGAVIGWQDAGNLIPRFQKIIDESGD